MPGWCAERPSAATLLVWHNARYQNMPQASAAGPKQAGTAWICRVSHAHAMLE
jgi:hypothetical protein